jgi:hypothetical protein
MRQDDVERPVAVLGEGLDGVGQGALLLDLIPHEQALDLDALQVVTQAAHRAVAVLESLVDVFLQVIMVFLDVNGLHKRFQASLSPLTMRLMPNLSIRVFQR